MSSCRLLAVSHTAAVSGAPVPRRQPKRPRSNALVEQSLAGDAYEHAGDLVFPDELGRPVHPNALSNRFVVRRKAAGVPIGSIHVLRHTAATLALEARVPLHVVAARLGDRPETLLATYAHLLPTSDAVAADAVAAVLA